MKLPTYRLWTAVITSALALAGAPSSWAQPYEQGQGQAPEQGQGQAPAQVQQWPAAPMNQVQPEYQVPPVNQVPLVNQGPPTNQVPIAPGAPLPKDAADCVDYLQKMNDIIQDYDQTVSSTLIGPQGINLDERATRAAALRTLKLARQLKKVHVPKEIAPEHKQFAASLPTLHDFFELNNGGPGMVNRAMALGNEIRQTLDYYHQGIIAMIQRHGLNPALDPVAAEQQAVTNRAVQGIQEWTNSAADAINNGLQKLMQAQPANPNGTPGEQYWQPAPAQPGLQAPPAAQQQPAPGIQPGQQQ